MKVTNDDVIRSGEQELIDGITADLDWNVIENLFVTEHRLPLGEDVSYKNGDLVVHDGQIAYLLEFEVKVPLSILLDRKGHCIQIQSAPPGDQNPDTTESDVPEADAKPLSEQPPVKKTGDDADGYEQTISSIFEDAAEASEDAEGQPSEDDSVGAGITRMADEAHGMLSEMGELGEA
ncbi:MAG: hypothetical protein PVG49_04805 [Desulfobacteraceae bacterium]|jgi:hypothetical protein